MKKKFKTNLFGVDIDSSSQSALRVETIGQAAIDKQWGENKIKLHVTDFDENHIRLTIGRTITNPSVSGTNDPGEMLQIDMAILFPQFRCIPDFGGAINIVRETQELLNRDIKQMQREIKGGSEISTFTVTTYPDKIEVLLSK